jgi:hypothetical protein
MYQYNYNNRPTMENVSVQFKKKGAVGIMYR